MEKENFAPTINFDQRDRYRLITRSPVSKEPLVASRRSLINLEFAASGVYPRAFSTFLSRTVNGKARFPHLHVPPPIRRERERERGCELARRLSSLHEAGVSEKWGAWVGRGVSLEGAGWKENGIRARKLIGSIQCHRGPRDARFVRSSREGRKRFFLSFPPRVTSPFDIRFYRRGRIRRRVSQGQCFPNSTTDAPIHRCIEYLTIVIDGATTMHLLFRMKLCYS